MIEPASVGVGRIVVGRIKTVRLLAEFQLYFEIIRGLIFKPCSGNESLALALEFILAKWLMLNAELEVHFNWI